MKIKKLKTLLVAICCLVAVLWTESQCAEQIIRNDEQPVINHQTGFIPAGNVMAFAGEMTPNGWLLCDGSPYHNQQYPELYQVVGLRYVNASTHRQWVIETNTRDNKIWFCVPDLRGRVIVGVDGGAGRVTSNNTIGAIGGEETHQLTVLELAIHEHNFYAHTHYINSVEAQAGSGRGIAEGSTRQTTSAGGNQPHNNMQPYTCLNYLINTGQVNGQQQNEILQLKHKINQLENSQQGCAKAWVVFNGSANILNSYGVSSVIRNSIGIYTINFSNPFISENYCPSLNASCPTGGMIVAFGPYWGTDIDAQPQRRDSFRFKVADYHNTLYDNSTFISACFYG